MFRLNKTLLYFLVLTAVGGALAFKIITKAYDNVYTDENFSGTVSYTHGTSSIKVSSPAANAVIDSSLTVSGEAKGSWYFEASFPVSLLDGNGNEVARAPAHAKGDWMTADFVPFEITLNFVQPKTSTGTLVLQKDNPSGDPARDESLSIPVRFAQ